MATKNQNTLLFFLTTTLLALSSLIISPRAFAQAPHFSKVVWIVFENTNFDEALNQPTFASIAKQGALFTNFEGSTHPSQGNYIAMIAGSQLGVMGDGLVNLNAPHLGDLIEHAGLTWRAYAEDFPGNCFVGKTYRNYARKHVPFMSFTSVNSNPARCANVQPGENFFRDLNAGHLPNYSMYIPNLQNDGHDTDANFAGNWLAKNFAPIISNPSVAQDTLFVITFDESESFFSNHIYTVLVGANVIPGSRNNQNLNHTAILKLIEDQWGLGNLHQEDASSPTITGIWR